MNFSLDQIVTFLCIAREGSLQRASKVLHKTQPSLSISMKNLEEILGVSLFDRRHYRIQLTDFGKVFRKKAQEFMEKARELEELADYSKQGRESKLCLAIDYFAPLSSLLSALADFQKNCPLTDFEYAFTILNEAEKKVLTGEADLAVTPFVENTHDLLIENLGNIEVVPVASSELFSSSRPSLSDIQKEKQVFITSKKSTHSYNELKDSNRCYVSDHLIKRDFILNGLGWGHLERSSVAKELKDKKLLVLKTPPLKIQKLPLYLIRKKSKAQGLSQKELWERLIQL